MIQYTFAVTRASNYYVAKVLIPNILFTFLSFAPFWLDVRSGERLSFGVTILLAMVAVDIIAAELLPVCPEYLFIEALVGGSILIAFLALIETCIVVYWYYKNQHEKENNVIVNKIAATSSTIKSVFNKKQENEDTKTRVETAMSNSTPTTTTGRNSLNSAHFDVDDVDDNISDVNTDMFLDAEEPAHNDISLTVHPRPQMTRVASLRNSFFNKSKENDKSFIKKKESRKRYLRERNLNSDYILMGQKLDRACRWIFIISYIIFLIIMFATIPIWRS